MKLVGSRIDRTRLRRASQVPDGQLGPYFNGDSPSDIILKSEDVAQVALEALGPEMFLLLRLNQLSRDPHPVARPEYRAFDYGFHVELAGNLQERLLGAFVAPHRGAGNHANLGDFAQ